MYFHWVCIWKMHYYHVFVVLHPQLTIIIYQNVFCWHQLHFHYILLLAVSFEFDWNCDFINVYGIWLKSSQLSQFNCCTSAKWNYFFFSFIIHDSWLFIQSQYYLFQYFYLHIFEFVLPFVNFRNLQYIQIDSLDGC